MRSKFPIAGRRDLFFAAFALAIAVCVIVSTVYADPVPYPEPDLGKWLVFGLEITLGEAIAWVVGAELLWRLTRRTIEHKQEEISRSDVYKTMLLAVLLSFSIGLLVWKIYGWI